MFNILRSRNILVLVIFFITIVLIRITGFSNVSLETKILILTATPIYFIWLILKYSKPGKIAKYRIITISCILVLFYVVAIIGYLGKYHTETLEKYRQPLTILVLGSLFLTVSVGGICTYFIKMNDDDYNNRLL